MSEHTIYRGFDLHITETAERKSVVIDGEEKAFVETDAGFQIDYQPPRASLMEAAVDFLDTQPTATPYRRSITDYTDDERQRLGGALNQLYDNGAAGNFIDAAAELHRVNFSTGIHWGPVFLPWHRDYLRKLEAAIQNIEGDLTLPYWDWTRADSRDLDLEPWKSFLGGRANRGGLFDHWDYNRNSTAAGWQLPMLTSASPDVVSVVDELRAGSYQDYRRIETGSHIPGHTWTGGTMASGRSPKDPLFYLHHCNLDRLWAIWQINNPAAEQYTLDPIDSDSSPQASVPADQPMVGGATPASMLDHETLGYRYPRDTALEAAWAAAGLGTLVTGS